MTTKKIKLKLYKILRNMNVSKNNIILSANYTCDIGFDEFDRNCLLNYLEFDFNILISDNDIQKLDTIGNTIDYLITKHINN